MLQLLGSAASGCRTSGIILAPSGSQPLPRGFPSVRHLAIATSRASGWGDFTESARFPSSSGPKSWRRCKRVGRLFRRARRWSLVHRWGCGVETTVTGCGAKRKRSLHMEGSGPTQSLWGPVGLFGDVLIIKF